MGKEFLYIFEEWAKDYDQTVSGKDEEYKEVFRGYDDILDTVARASVGKVLEFGAGTGNLTAKLLDKGHEVIVIEPSIPMREIAQQKLQSERIEFVDGDFLQYPSLENIDSVVSTYAFHHLTDQEKADAVKEYGKLLGVNGKIVFADTMYESKEAHYIAIEDAKKQGFMQLAKDLQTEYYTTIPYLQTVFEDNGFTVSFKRSNQFVWILEAIKL
ncbi:class I SAM-dependent methyltransferase [Bacillus massiliigorillae]|uniref:class I SAM-dependent methyltransferase n=1 Tax=Bacillus massiliigorillae TaxID=1243664 RepID=UPI0003A8BFF0|nr:class I SAM-dependent methyltransferase [Bacillus massiliigorillae]